MHHQNLADIVKELESLDFLESDPDYYSDLIFSRLFLIKGTNYGFFANHHSVFWVCNDEVILEVDPDEILDSVSEDIVTKILFHLDILRGI